MNNLLQKQLKFSQEFLLGGRSLQLQQARHYWPRKKTYAWIYPPYFKRYPPTDGSPPKVYPLEAAPQEFKDKGCYMQDRWTDWRMKKDYLRRKCVQKHGRERMMLNTIHMNTILPFEIRDAAMREVQENFPRDSDAQRLVERCAISSRPRATTEPWRVGRMILRHLADYNKLAGVQRGIW